MPAEAAAIFRSGRRAPGEASPGVRLPRGAAPLGRVLLVVVLSLLVVGVLIPVPSTVSVSGELRYAEPVVIASGRRAVIEEVLAHEGDEVQKGQPLFLLTSGGFLAEGTKLTVIERVALARRVLALFTQYELEQRLYARYLRALDRQAQALERERATAEQLLPMLRDLANAEAERYEAAARLQQTGYISGDEYARRRSLAVNASRAMREQKGVVARVETEQSSLVVKRAVDERNHRVRLLEIFSRLQEARREQANVSAADGVLVRAPGAGVLVEVAGRAGGTVQPGDMLARVSPDAGEMSAVIWVEVGEAARMEPGLPVSLSLEAISRIDTGPVLAKIDELSRVPEGRSAERAGLVEVRLDFEPGHLERLRSALRLRHQMPFSASVRLESTSLAHKVLRRLTPADSV